MLRALSISLMVLMLSGCDTEAERSSGVASTLEGMAEGDCRDALDNDQDGEVDCDDRGCAAAEACRADLTDMSLLADHAIDRSAPTEPIDASVPIDADTPDAAHMTDAATDLLDMATPTETDDQATCELDGFPIENPAFVTEWGLSSTLIATRLEPEYLSDRVTLELNHEALSVGSGTYVFDPETSPADCVICAFASQNTYEDSEWSTANTFFATSGRIEISTWNEETQEIQATIIDAVFREIAISEDASSGADLQLIPAGDTWCFDTFTFDSDVTQSPFITCDDTCNGALTGTDGQCIHYGPSGIFTGGTLSCDDECQVDTSECVRRDHPEHESCQFHAGWPRGACAEGLVCAANGLISTAMNPLYQCLRTCRGPDDTMTCGEGYVCIAPESNGMNLVNGFEHVCLRGPFEREARCDHEPGVCDIGLQCLPTGHPQSGPDFILGPRSQCKLTCSLEGDNNCPDDEQCFPDPLGNLNPEEGIGLCGDPVTPCSIDISMLESNWFGFPVNREAVDWFVDTYTACREANGTCSLPEGSGHSYCDRPVSSDPARSMSFATCVDFWVPLPPLELKTACIAFCESDLDCGDGTDCARPIIPISRNPAYNELAGMACGSIFSQNQNLCRQIEVNPGEQPYGCYLLNSETAVCARARKQCVLPMTP